MAEYPNQRLAAGALEVEGVNAGAGSGVSWGAVLAGALGAAALSLILVLLGTGFGLSSISLGRPAAPARRRSAWRPSCGSRSPRSPLRAWGATCRPSANQVGGRADRRGVLSRHGPRIPGLGTRHTGDRGRAHITIGAVLGTGAQAGASMTGARHGRGRRRCRGRSGCGGHGVLERCGHDGAARLLR